MGGGLFHIDMDTTIAVCRYLSQSISESDGKEEVSVSRASMYPQVPEDRTQNGGNEEHTHHH